MMHPLSPKLREAADVPVWSYLIQDRLREAADALDAAQAENERQAHQIAALNAEVASWKESFRFQNDVIARLRAELERARTALKPFADYVTGNAAKSLPDDMSVTYGSSMARPQITVKDCRVAAAILDTTAREG